MLKKTNLIDTNFQIKSQDHHKSETNNHIQELHKMTSGVHPSWQAIILYENSTQSTLQIFKKKKKKHKKSIGFLDT